MRRARAIAFFVATGLLLLGPAVSFALNGKVDGKEVSEGQYAADTLWVVVTAMLVFFMQAGFALVETGFTRAKNAVNILMKNIMDFALGSAAYWAIGFAIMFGAGNWLFGHTGFFVTSSMGDEEFGALAWTSVPTMAAWFFQLVFAGTAATIVSGAMAERTKFPAYLLYSFLISAIFYPVVGHWIWGGGWLAELGMLDFAGSTVVHSTGGWFALAGALVLGARRGKYGPGKRVNAIPGHSLPLATLGVFILWLGWFGFNPGSTMAADPVAIALTATNTNLAAAAGAIGAMGAAWLLFGKPDAGMTLNGALAGLVAVTCACAFVTPAAAFFIFGILPGVAVVFSVLLFDRLRIDDPVGAISVHGVCGALGTALLGLFHTEQGLFYSGKPGFFLVQVSGVASVAIFSVACGVGLFLALKHTVGLRVTEEEELNGLDLGEHGASAYPDFQLVSHGGRASASTGGSAQPQPEGSPVLRPATVR